jgi:hypothetical protein
MSTNNDEQEALCDELIALKAYLYSSWLPGRLGQSRMHQMEVSSAEPAVSLVPRSERNPTIVLSTLGECLRYSLLSVPRRAWHLAL